MFAVSQHAGADRIPQAQAAGWQAEPGEATQAEAIAFLSDGANHAGGGPVEIVRTHAALVFLAGDSAWKIKRAVRYDYLDFSTLDRRRDMLLHELQINTPAAPQIYRDVVPLARDAAGGLALGGSGQPVEWVLRMNRFDADCQLDRIATGGRLTDALAVALGEAVADYHAGAPPRPGADGPALIAAILDELNRAFAGMVDAFGGDPSDRFRAATDTALPRLAPLLRQRAATGHVRRFHGDLHLRNIALIDGKPVLFDALEFDETLGTGDVLYDLAFLVMDLLHRGLRKPANLVLNAYLFRAACADHDAGLAALPLFMAIRAAIRAMVAVQTARLATVAGAELPEARAYLEMALAFLAPAPARLVAVGGLSGTGKSTLAAALAPTLGRAPGAIHLRSDTARKALFGVAPETRLPLEAYGDAVSARVYAQLMDRAVRILRVGQSVVLDATFLKEAERAALAQVAAEAGVRLEGLWLEASTEALEARVSAREHDASDADAGVVRAQAARTVPPLFWTRLDASGDPATTLRAATGALGGAAEQSR